MDDRTIERLTRQITIAERDITSITNDLTAMQRKITAANTELRPKVATEASQNKQLTEAARQLQAAQTKHDGFVTSHTNALTAVNEAKAELARLESEAEELAADLRLKETELGKLQEDVGVYRQKMNEAA